MERFWNIIYYFAYRADDKLTWYFYKYTGLLKLYNLPFYKKQFEKGGIKDPVSHLMNAWKNHELGLSSFVALALVVGGKFSFILGLFMCFPNRNLPIELLIVCFAVAFLHDYIFLLHKNKWLNTLRNLTKSLVNGK